MFAPKGMNIYDLVVRDCLEYALGSDGGLLTLSNAELDKWVEKVREDDNLFEDVQEACNGLIYSEKMKLNARIEEKKGQL
jgi:hypothetical protein